ncbi:aldolase [Rhizobium sp. ACO-34A]|nr:class II aldolase/adducin family protein [Rhizobium sp. ACO-34A]ATN32793.1 aldolase [Rhizobium sp. ACO-34A]
MHAFSENTLNELVLANHILDGEGIVDGFGHVSVRDPARADRFWMSRSKAPALVERNDLLILDMDGVVHDDDRTPYLERFIHAEIYRARPDVMAIVHSHSPAVIPFTVARDIKLRPICHVCGFVNAATSFEIREFGGSDTDLLIKNAELGSALARSLGNSNLILMRGHGVTVVGTTLRQAVFRAIYTELSARLQRDALQISSDIVFLTDEEADAASAVNDAQIDRAWELWVRNLGDRERRDGPDGRLSSGRGPL